jgi:hypothetical protein
MSTTLSISKDTSSLTTGVNALVKAFNDFQTTASSLGNYNAATKQAGALNGESTLRSAQNAFVRPWQGPVGAFRAAPAAPVGHRRHPAEGRQTGRRYGRAEHGDRRRPERRGQSCRRLSAARSRQPPTAWSAAAA